MPVQGIVEHVVVRPEVERHGREVTVVDDGVDTHPDRVAKRPQHHQDQLRRQPGPRPIQKPRPRRAQRPQPSRHQQPRRQDLGNGHAKAQLPHQGDHGDGRDSRERVPFTNPQKRIGKGEQDGRREQARSAHHARGARLGPAPGPQHQPQQDARARARGDPDEHAIPLGRGGGVCAHEPDNPLAAEQLNHKGSHREPTQGEHEERACQSPEFPRPHVQKRAASRRQYQCGRGDRGFRHQLDVLG
jgi:hypothetical protein